MPELRINPDKVCEFLEAAREVAGKVPATSGDQTSTGDDSPLAFMEEDVSRDPVREQMIEFVAGLNVEEQTDLLALIYLGRGDFSLSEWDEALREAGDRIAAGDPRYMIGERALPAYLEEALEKFDKTCPD
ncbi:MAG: DUF3775 domain-containing protein [Rhodospirillales bacterium]|nr:DUF3775 domain-containing protein [Rhodospirillales bacterium]